MDSTASLTASQSGDLTFLGTYPLCRSCMPVPCVLSHFELSSSSIPFSDCSFLLLQSYHPPLLPYTCSLSSVMLSVPQPPLSWLLSLLTI